MSNQFNFRYTAPTEEERKEIDSIRRQYSPQEQTETKLERLRRLDSLVKNTAVIWSLVLGVLGCLIFGLGLCLAMQVIGSGIFAIALGVFLGIVGIVSMIVAYPIYRKVFDKTKEKFAPRILELTAELTGEKNSAL